MESNRHRNSVKRIRELLKTLGVDVLINDHSRGDHGYRFEPVWSEKHQKFVTLTADTLARMPGGMMADFEVNYKLHHEADDAQRTVQLNRWFIVVVPVTPQDVDLWVKEPGLITKEVDYRFKEQFGKIVQPLLVKEAS